MYSVWSCDAVDYVDPRRFRREDAEGCEKPAENQMLVLQENQLPTDCDSNVSMNPAQTVSKLELLFDTHL